MCGITHMDKCYNKAETYSNLNSSHIKGLRISSTQATSRYLHTLRHSTASSAVISKIWSLHNAELVNRTTLQNICRNLFAKQYENQRAEHTKEQTIVSTVHVWEDRTYMAKPFFNFAQILPVGYPWHKNVSSKIISVPAFGVHHTSMPRQNGWKVTLACLASNTSVTTAHRNRLQMKHQHSNTYSS